MYQLHVAVRHKEFTPVHIHVRLHFKTPGEIYACDSITTSTGQQYSQTLTGSFFTFTIFICSWASSCKRPFNPYTSRGHLREPFQ